MNLYDGAKIRVRSKSTWSLEFDAKVRMHHGSVLSPFLLSVEVEDVTELAMAILHSKLLHSHDLELMSETIEKHRNNFRKCKEVLREGVPKLTLRKPKWWSVKALQKTAIYKYNLPTWYLQPDNERLLGFCVKNVVIQSIVDVLEGRLQTQSIKEICLQ